MQHSRRRPNKFFDGEIDAQLAKQSLCKKYIKGILVGASPARSFILPLLIGYQFNLLPALFFVAIYCAIGAYGKIYISVGLFDRQWVRFALVALVVYIYFYIHG